MSDAETIPTLREALEAIADGEGDAVVIARQTLDVNPTDITPDVRALVIAGREAFDTGCLPDDEERALDTALERFAALVPYADDGHE